ncbi:hypothetical protein ASE74_13540 [Pedobacter sp. Leaf216]|uniref:hypothetical protein n=1 Tax=Pedobacter sp. Leaf216 TaxID=1735684 RepID=UPI0006F50A8A|nr:hypothetical protein [Pedobacter sp. Leaf216]KQM78520.1 hypothetical protein ASE74_13540 [Pedobacter sp. Leaf216]
MITRPELQHKNILYIGVKFYYYHQQLIEKLEDNYGAKVDYFPERDTSIIYGIINRLNPSRLEAYQELHYKKILTQITNKKFDYFLVIRGFKMPLWFVKKIKSLNPGLKLINYQWDSNTNSPFINLTPAYNILPEFDVKLTFDYKDVEDHAQLNYSPTFYTDEIKELGEKTNNGNFKYDLFYFGSYLPERYKGLLKFMEFAKKHNYSVKFHFYMPIRYFIIERLKGVKIDWKLIKFGKMSRTNYINNLSMSKTIIDVSNTKQSGMAMRVLDALGSGKKVITTNKWVAKDDIYNPKQIAIIDIENIELPDGFIEDNSYLPRSAEFNLNRWIERVFIESFEDTITRLGINPISNDGQTALKQSMTNTL